MRNVTLLTNIQTPYRIPFWEELGKKVNLTVLFEAKTEIDRNWEVTDKFNNFKAIFLKGFTIKNTKIHINYSFFEYLKNTENVVIIGAYHNITDILAILYLRFIKKKKFIMLHDGCFYKDGNKLMMLFKSFLIKSASKYLLSGENAINSFSKYGANKKDITKAFFTCDIDYYISKSNSLNKELLRKEFSKYNLARRIVLCVARLVKEKGIMDLIKATENMEDVTTIFIGIGKDENIFKEYIKLANLNNILFLGSKDEDEICKFYKLADVFVLPSHYDPWGLVINEAMCFKLPIITTHMTGASYDLIHDGGNGFVVKTADIDGLRDRIKELIFDDVKLKSFGEKSFEIISKWDLKNSVSAYYTCIEEMRCEEG